MPERLSFQTMALRSFLRLMLSSLGGGGAVTGAQCCRTRTINLIPGESHCLLLYRTKVVVASPVLQTRARGATMDDAGRGRANG